jgi:hypothetical protein
MKIIQKIVFVFLLIVLSFKVSYAQNMSVLYKEAYKLEKMRTYNESRTQYLKICQSFINSYDSAPNKKALLLELPLAIGATCRLSIVTGKDNYANLYQLVSQMASYKETHQIIERMINIIVEYRLARKASISKYVEGELLFARAYNRIAWANKLLISIPWKNYIVFPVNDLLGMVNVAIKDLTQQLDYDGISYEAAVRISSRGLMRNRDLQKLYKAYYAQFFNRFKKMKKGSLDYKIYKKIYMSANDQELAQAVVENKTTNSFLLVDYYYSDFVKGVLRKARTYHDMESILSSKERGVFQVFDEMVSILDISQKNAR